MNTENITKASHTAALLVGDLRAALRDCLAHDHPQLGLAWRTRPALLADILRDACELERRINRVLGAMEGGK